MKISPTQGERGVEIGPKFEENFKHLVVKSLKPLKPRMTLKALVPKLLMIFKK